MTGTARRTLVLGALVAVIVAVAIGGGVGAVLGDARRAAEAELSGVDDASYRVDAVFDTAKGVLPGQLVKIAGARAGTIERVTLTRAYQARIQMRVDRRFEPFRRDARCSIKPEGLIGERFIQCDPGSPRQRPLAARGGRPTVPVERTTLPVALTELFGIYDAPARARLGVVLSTLGMATAGRGADLNAILRRANPALASTRRLLEVIAGQRRQLRGAIADTDAIVAELARRRGRVRAAVDHAARVTGQTAARRGELRTAIRRLPGMLAEAEPALERLHDLAADATPVLDDVRTAAPAVERLVERAEPFALAATPVVRDLGGVLPRARRAVGPATPVVAQARRFAVAALPTARDLGRLTVDLRDRGFVEHLLLLTYRLSATMARFDSVSHLTPTQLFLQPGNGCLVYATTPNPNCDARYHRTAATARARTRRDDDEPRREPREGPRRDEAPAREDAPRPQAAPQRPSRPAPQVPRLPLPKLPDLPPVELPKVPDVQLPAPGQGGDERPSEPASDLLDFLLG